MKSPYITNITKFFYLTWVIILLTGCTISSQNIETAKEFVPGEWKTIAIMPFVNNELLGAPSSAWLAYRLNDQKKFKIINSAQVEILLSDHNIKVSREETDSSPIESIPQTIYPVKSEQGFKNSKLKYKVKWFSDKSLIEVGHTLNVDAVLTGYIRLFTGPQRYLTVGLRIIDIRSGKPVFNSKNSSIAFGFYDYTNNAKTVIDSAAASMLKKLIPDYIDKYSVVNTEEFK